VDNYIGKIDAEWVDPRVELPPEGVAVIGYFGTSMFGDQIFPVECINGNWGESYHGPSWACDPPIRWLRIGGPSTAIPRDLVGQVQAAVDEMRCAKCGCVRTEAQGGKIFAMCDDCRCTGITPTEVTP